MEMKKEKSDQNAVAELTREGLYKENKWLWEENKKLKSDLAYERAMLDNVRAEYDSLQNVNKKLKEEIERMKKDTMYDMKDINSLYKENQKLKKRVIELEKEKEFLLEAHSVSAE